MSDYNSFKKIDRLAIVDGAVAGVDLANGAVASDELATGAVAVGGGTFRNPNAILMSCPAKKVIHASKKSFIYLP